MNTWKLRDEILKATHRWYLIVACFLAGALIGWGISYICPSPYRATIDLHLGLNAYRSPYDGYIASVAQQEFRMVDDYKNWQLSHLNDLVLTDDFMEETLRRLRVQDTSWDDVTTHQLRVYFRGVWRNVGVWHLVAEGRDADSMSRAVEVWSDVIVEFVGDAIEHSKNVVALDIHMTALSETQINLETRQEILVYVASALSNWQDEVVSLPADQPVSSQTHWDILALVTQAADWNLGWDAALEGVPALGSPAQDYADWLEFVTILVDQELQALSIEIEAVEQQRQETETEYKQETVQSRALASTLFRLGR